MFIAGVILLVVSGLLIAITVLVSRKSRGQHRWPQVPGVITRSRILRGESIDADIEYQYVHKGRTLRSTKVRSHPVSVNWSGPAERLVDKYPEGASVNVYVNPDDVLDGVLQPGGDGRFAPTMFSAAALTAVIGLAMLIGR